MRSRACGHRAPVARLVLAVRPSLVLLAALGGIACGNSSQSFILVTVESATATPITPVSALVVTVTNGASSQILTYPAPGGTPFTITATPGTTFSVSFSASHTDDVVFQVAALNAAGATVAVGQATTQLTPGGVGAVIIDLSHPCDPAALDCGAAMTCAVDCSTQGQPGVCVTAGTGAAGALCADDTDCTPGAQCFSYGDATTPACQLNVCRKFCNVDGDCGGNGSLCQGQVPCTTNGTTTLTTYHTCTLACDPRGAATTGCPAGLHCFLVGAADQVDCACTQAAQTKAVGQTCASNTECAPGQVCTTQCHKLCKLAENGADCGAGQTCTGLVGDQIYGVCLP